MRAVGRGPEAEFDGFRTRFQALPVAAGARKWYQDMRAYRQTDVRTETGRMRFLIV